MPGIEDQVRSSVIVLECPNGFILERRPEVKGIIHPGQLGLFGGHLEPGEDPPDSWEDPLSGLVRELREETDLDPDTLGIVPVWLDQPGRHGPHGIVGEIMTNTFYGTTTRCALEVGGEGGYEVLSPDRFTGEVPPDMTLFAYFAIKNLPIEIRRQV